MLDIMSIIQLVNMILKLHEMYHFEKQMNNLVQLLQFGHLEAYSTDFGY